MTEKIQLNELLSAFGFDMDNSLYALKLRNEGQIEIHKKNVLDKLDLNKVVNKGLPILVAKEMKN